MCAAARMFHQAFAHFPGEVQPGKAWILLFEFLDDAQALAIVLKAAMAAHKTIQHGFAFVTKGRVAKIVGESDGLGEIFIEPQRPRDVPGNACDLNRVRETRAEMIARAVQEDLRLVLKPAKPARVNDAVAIALVLRAPLWRRFLVLSPTCLGAELRVRSKELTLARFKLES